MADASKSETEQRIHAPDTDSVTVTESESAASDLMTRSIYCDDESVISSSLEPTHARRQRVKYTIPAQSQLDFTIAPAPIFDDESRVHWNESQVLCRVESGEAEIHGCPLEAHRQYALTRSGGFGIYSWRGCSLQLTYSPHSFKTPPHLLYASDSESKTTSPMVKYLNLHAFLDKLRSDAAEHPLAAGVTHDCAESSHTAAAASSASEMKSDTDTVESKLKKKKKSKFARLKSDASAIASLPPLSFSDFSLTKFKALQREKGHFAADMHLAQVFDRCVASMGPRLLVLGATDSGKSSLCRSLLNYALRKHESAPWFVDCDPGQNALSVPGSVSATIADGFIAPLVATTDALDHSSGSGQQLSDGVFSSAVRKCASDLMSFGKDHVVFCFGSTAPTHDTPRYFHALKQLSSAILRKLLLVNDCAKMEEMKRTDGSRVDADLYESEWFSEELRRLECTRHSGVVLNSCGLVDTSLPIVRRMLPYIIALFRVNCVVILESEATQRSAELKSLVGDCPTVEHCSVIAANPAVKVRSSDVRRGFRNASIAKYFFGCADYSQMRSDCDLPATVGTVDTVLSSLRPEPRHSALFSAFEVSMYFGEFQLFGIFPKDTFHYSGKSDSGFGRAPKRRSFGRFSDSSLGRDRDVGRFDSSDSDASALSESSSAADSGRTEHRPKTFENDVFYVKRLRLNERHLHNLMAVTYAQTPAELLTANVAGYLCINDIDFDTRQVRVLLNCPLPFPGLLLHTNVRWFDAKQWQSFCHQK